MVIVAKKENYLHSYFFGDKEIKQIVLFNEKNKYIIPRGWLEDVSPGFSKDIKEIELKELLNKRKVDFSLKKSYLANFEDWYNRKVLTLFIYIPNFSKDIKRENTGQNVYIYNLLSFDLNGKKIVVEILDHMEKTDFGRKIEELKKEMESKNINIDSYTLEKILTEYEVIKK